MHGRRDDHGYEYDLTSCCNTMITMDDRVPQKKKNLVFFRAACVSDIERKKNVLLIFFHSEFRRLRRVNSCEHRIRVLKRTT